MKLTCSCGNVDPDKFSIVEERTVWLSVVHNNGEFFAVGSELLEEMTKSTRLWCDACATEQEIT